MPQLGAVLVITIIIIALAVLLYIYVLNRRLYQQTNAQLLGEERLRNSESRYRVLFETAPFAGMIWRDGYIVMDWNPQAEAVFGFKREEVLGKSFFDLIIPASEKAAMEAELSAISQDNAQSHGFHSHETRDGEVLNIEWFHARLPLSSAPFQEVLSFGIDITQRGKRKAKLSQMLSQLGQSESDQRMLLSVVSHEFRTPTAIIKASLDSLAFFKDQIPADVASRLENIGKASQRLNELANNLIAFDRVQELALKPQMEMLNLGRLASDVLAQYPADNKLRLQLPDYPLLLEGDSILLGIALHNLIDNALRYHANAEVPIIISIEQVVDDIHHWLVIKVADQGQGIPDAQKELVFQRFYSTKGSQSDGLGLSIVKSIAISHGGNAFALDNQPRGAVMVMQLRQ